MMWTGPTRLSRALVIPPVDILPISLKRFLSSPHVYLINRAPVTAKSHAISYNSPATVDQLC